MEIRYTNHAEDKLAEEIYFTHVPIHKPLIEEVILHPESLEITEDDKIRAVRGISQTLSLVVIYRDLGEYLLVITFWPARKGRYER